MSAVTRDPPRRRGPATAAPRGYVICTEHRSGSTFLCQLLQSTGVLGRPREYFADSLLGRRLDRDPEALGELLAQSSTPNGVYGAKIITQQFDTTLRSRWAERLPGLHLVHLTRRDLLGQAISCVRALQTDQYLARAVARGEPEYDAALIAGHLARLADNEARWRRYFARNGLAPLWLVYEDVAAEPSRAVAAVAALVGLTEAAVIDPAALSVTVQRDPVSEAWRARFIADAGDLARLDHRHGAWRIWLRRFARDVHYLRRMRRLRP